MKKVLLVLALMTIGTNANSQLEVSTTKTETVWSSKNNTQSLKHFTTGDHELYAFYYKNLEYKTITDIKHLKIDSKEEVTQLMDLIIGAIGAEESTRLTLNGKMVLLADLDGKSCIILTTGTHTILTEKQANEIKEALNGN